MPSAPPYAILISVCDSSIERDRLADFLDALFHFEPHCPALVVINDHGDGDLLRDVICSHVPSHCQLALLDNPRPRGGWSGSGRFTCGLAEGHRWILQNLKVDCVLKMDPDTLIIAPFGEQLCARVRAEPQIGLFGSHYHARRPQPGFAYHAARMRRLSRRFGLWRRPRWHLRTPWARRNRKLRQLFADAFACGYEAGENCLGGGYAITTEALRRIATHGLYDDKYFFCNVPVPCDLTFAMLVRAVGLEIRSFDCPGEPFSIWHGELPDTPQNLLAAGHAIIHSLKGYHGWNEETLRGYFRMHRRSRKKSSVAAELFR
jgi:hypothetical protein